MKKLLLISGAALALGFAGASSAAALCPPAATAGTLPGFYAGVGLGWGGMDTPKLTRADLDAYSVTASGTDKLRKGVAARGYLGYLWAISQVQNLQLGAELGYNYYPKNKYTMTINNYTDSWNYKGYTVDLLGVAKYNFGTTGFNALLKAGPAYVRQKLTFTPTPSWNVPANLSASKGKVKAELAGGLGYDINQNIDVNVIVAHVFGSKPASIGSNAGVPTKAGMNKVASVTTYMATIAYHFGDLNM